MACSQTVPRSSTSATSATAAVQALCERVNKLACPVLLLPPRVLVRGITGWSDGATGAPTTPSCLSGGERGLGRHLVGELDGRAEAGLGGRALRVSLINVRGEMRRNPLLLLALPLTGRKDTYAPALTGRTTFDPASVTWLAKAPLLRWLRGWAAAVGGGEGRRCGERRLVCP